MDVNCLGYGEHAILIRRYMTEEDLFIGINTSFRIFDIFKLKVGEYE
ncbi:hypothetical protein BDD39_000850 [Saccharococcus thermophilus]|uniref:Uncharacterized protein n=1 Tax=Saccharococcus thermophilus TaxID=29396 RepID=A0A846MDW9_9BACL|nr:hypothetical protein [Saccharococcus thermophilus]